MDDIKTQILQTSSNFFIKYGFRSVSIDDVCNELHISKKTFYLYFRQKEELIEAVLDQYCDINKEATAKQKAFWNDPSLNSIDKIIAGTQYWNNSEGNDAAAFFYDLLKYYPDVYNKMLVRKEQEAIQEIKEWLEKGISEGIFRNDTDIDLLASFINNHIRKAVPEMMKGTYSEFPKSMEFLLDCCIRIITNEKGYRYYQEKYHGRILLIKKPRRKKNEQKENR